MRACLLTAEEEQGLADRINVLGDQDARRRLILAHLGLVIGLAGRFGIAGRDTGPPLEDLIQEGNLGLIRASEDFNPRVHGCRFATYAEVWIKASFRRAVVENQWPVRYPQHVFLERLSHEIPA